MSRARIAMAAVLILAVLFFFTKGGGAQALSSIGSSFYGGDDAFRSSYKTLEKMWGPTNDSPGKYCFGKCP